MRAILGFFMMGLGGITFLSGLISLLLGLSWFTMSFMDYVSIEHYRTYKSLVEPMSLIGFGTLVIILILGFTFVSSIKMDLMRDNNKVN